MITGHVDKLEAASGGRSGEKAQGRERLQRVLPRRLCGICSMRRCCWLRRCCCPAAQRQGEWARGLLFTTARQPALLEGQHGEALYAVGLAGFGRPLESIVGACKEGSHCIGVYVVGLGEEITVVLSEQLAHACSQCIDAHAVVLGAFHHAHHSCLVHVARTSSAG